MEDTPDKLLILDLDETLIHASSSILDIPFDFKVDTFFVYERPGLRTFLQDIFLHFSVGIWSSASDEYVAEIVRQIMPAGVDPLLVWGRSKCTFKRDPVYDIYYYEKRLDKLKKKGFGLEKILIVDDSPSKSRSNYGNAIYINEFAGEANDCELSFLYDYLLTLKEVPNVRVIEKRGWRSLKDK